MDAGVVTSSSSNFIPDIINSSSNISDDLLPLPTTSNEHDETPSDTNVQVLTREEFEALHSNGEPHSLFADGLLTKDDGDGAIDTSVSNDFEIDTSDQPGPESIFFAVQTTAESVALNTNDEDSNESFAFMTTSPSSSLIAAAHLRQLENSGPQTPKRELEEVDELCDPYDIYSFLSSTGNQHDQIVPSKRAHLTLSAAALPDCWYLNKNIRKLDIFRKSSGAALRQRRAIRKTLAQQQKQKSNLTPNKTPVDVFKQEGDDSESVTTTPIINGHQTHAFATTDDLDDHFDGEVTNGAVTTNGHYSSPSDCYYDYYDDDYRDEAEDPEVDRLTGCIKLRPPPRFDQQFYCYKKYEEEEGFYENGTMNGYNFAEIAEPVSVDYQHQQQTDNFKPPPPLLPSPPLPPLQRPPPPTRPSAKQQKALQKKTSRYMSKKLEKASLPQVLTGNQLPTGTGKFLVVSLNCPVATCRRSFPGKAQLDSHLFSEHALHPFMCVYLDCGASFATSDELTTHTSTTHSLGPFICKLCPTGSDKKSNTQPSYEMLAKHHFNYHQTGEFRCPVYGCTNSPSAPNRLLAVRHYHHVHQPYACTWKHCKQTFAYQPELDKHIAGHAAPRPFPCPHPGCGKTFLTKAHLAEHERIHTGVKPYICTYAGCDYAAKTRNSVLVHVRSKHLGMTRMTGAEKEAAERLHEPHQYVEVRRELL